MLKQFLISQMIEDNGVEKEQFYTVTSENTFKYIGDSLDWSEAFNAANLDNLRNNQFKLLRKGRLYVNECELDYARIVCMEGYVRNINANQALHTAFNKLTSVGVVDVFGSNSTYAQYKYQLAYSFTTNDIKDGYYKVIKDTDVPRSDLSLLTGPFPANMTCTAGYEDIMNKAGSVEVDAEDENIVWVKHNVDKFNKISGIAVQPKNTCKLPVNIEFQIYKDDHWETVLSDKITSIKKYEKRFYDKNYTTKEIRWLFKYDSSDHHNSSTKLALTNLNVIGAKTGTKLEPCKFENLKHDDMISKNESDMRTGGAYGALADIMQHYNDEFYHRKLNGGVINWIIDLRINPGPNVYQTACSGITMINKANGAPYLANIVASNKGSDGYSHVHREDVIIDFDINDVEEDVVGFNVYADSISDNTKIIEVKDLESNLRYSITIGNEHFKAMNEAGTAYTTLYIVPYDNNGAIGGYNPIYVYKQNKLPTILSTMSENSFTVTVTDPDNDRVSCKLFINDFEFAEFSLKESPAVHSFIVPSTKIKIGVKNTIKMVASDDMPGETNTVTATHKFIGAYYGLLFANENEDVLTTEFDDILKKIDFGTIIAGNTSFAQQLKVLNKTGIELPNILIKSIINDNPSEEYRIEFDTDEDFTNPRTSLTINTLANGGKYPFYVRVASKSLSATPQSAEFDVSGESNY